MKMTLVFLQLLTVTALGATGFFLWPLMTELLWIAGLVVGVLLLWGDEQIGYQWYQNSVGESSSSPVSNPASSTAPIAAPYLITRSLLFLVALIPLSLYVVTSTSSSLGWGLVLGLVTSITWELLWWRRLPDQFRTRFFSNSSRVPAQTIAWWPWVWLALSLGLLLLLII